MENNETPVVSELSVPAESINQNKKMFVYGFLGLIIAVVILATIVSVVRVYKYSATDRFTVSVAKALRLPALKVNSVSVPYTDYVDDLNAIRIMREFDKTNNGAGASLSDEDLTDQVVMRQVNNIIVEQSAATMGITADQSDIDTLKNQVLTQYKTVSAVDTELKKRYGWDFATYEQKVMRPYVLQAKLNEKISGDQEARTRVRAAAQSVLDQIKAGADFATMAKQYGEDGTKDKGGDLGFFGKGEMVPQFEAAAFALKKGELSKELVESPFGYHIIQVTDKKTENVKDSTTGKIVATPKVQARHILFMFPTLQQYLQKELLKANIHLYLKVRNPVETLKQQINNQAAGIK